MRFQTLIYITFKLLDMRQLLLVLLIAVTTSVTASAQKDYRDNDRDNRRNEKFDRQKYDRNDPRYDKYDRYDNKTRNKQELRRRVAIINSEYDSKINSVRRNPFIRSRVKARRIHDLESQRRIALNEVRQRYSGRRQRDYTLDDKYKRGR